VEKSLPEMFGVIFDGWSDGGYHYLCVFANYQENGCKKTPFLGMKPFNEASFKSADHLVVLNVIYRLTRGNIVNFRKMYKQY
jgi:hypothetical protein